MLGSYVLGPYRVLYALDISIQFSLNSVADKMKPERSCVYSKVESECDQPYKGQQNVPASHDFFSDFKFQGQRGRIFHQFHTDLASGYRRRDLQQGLAGTVW